jgi:ATP-binding cassette subfamily B protein
MSISRYSDFFLYRRLLRLAKPYWLHILGIFLLTLLATPLTLLTPLPLKIAVDSVLGSEPLPAFLKLLLPAALYRSETALLLLVIVLLLAIALLNQLQTLANLMLRTYTSEKLLLDFRSRLFHHAQRLSLSHHDMKGSSDSLYRIQYDTNAIKYITIEGVIPFISAAFTLVAMLYIIFRLEWQLALVGLTVSPVLFLIARVYRRNLRRRSRKVKRLESGAMSVVQEVLSTLRVVKAFGQEDYEQERFFHQSNRGIRAKIRLSLAEGGMSVLLGFTTAGGTAAVLFIGVRSVQGGTLTLGELLLIMSYLAQLYGPLKTISKKIASLQSHLASAERSMELLDQAPDVPEKPGARSLRHAKGHITFQKVSFAYRGSPPVLREISLDIPAGMRVGLTGRTGTGKTTLTSLLTRFYDPTAGRILLDGVDLRDYRLADIRRQFSLVLQETVLFSTSIAENIAYARPHASETEIIEAAKAANVHEFIISLPDGYATPVGERGMRLSGGERQRIGLARAFLRNTPILLLDEPTSSVDMKTEMVIIEALDRLMKGRTTFMIAHRLTTLKHCDLLLVLENGRLATVESNVPEVITKAVELGELDISLSEG